MDNESTRNVLTVIVLLCLVCSVVVASTAVWMRPYQEANKAADINRNILQVAGLYREDVPVDELFRSVRTRWLDLRDHSLSDTPPTDMSRRELSRDEDVAGIQSLESAVKVFLVYDGAVLDQVVLPVRGYGLWSTLHGFLSVQSDGRTVRGLQFYDHKETPGLGGEVDNPRWRAQWRDKSLFDDNDELRLRVAKGMVRVGAADAKFQVDGLAGATLTSRGVTNMLKFWFSEDAYGPFLAKLREGALWGV